MSKFYGRIKKWFGGLIRRLYRIKIVGAENEPEEGPFVVCANHISNQDVVILAASLKHQVRFLAKAELFKIPILAPLIKSLGAYPVNRGKGDVGAIKNTIKLIENGEVVGLYPQGHRFAGVHPTDSEIKSGIGLIVAKTKVTVLPVAIQTKKFKVCIFKKTKVIIGKPIYYEDLPEFNGVKSEYYNSISSTVFSKICDLLDKDAIPQPKRAYFLVEGKKLSDTIDKTDIEKQEHTSNENQSHLSNNEKQ